MPLVSPLSDADCTQLKSLRDMGPVLINLTPYCKPAAQTKDIWYRPVDQRSAASLNLGTQYTDNPNQVSSINNRLEAGQSAELNISLGRRILQPETLALALNSEVQVDAGDSNVEYVDISDRPGRVPDHYQVVIVPYLGATKIDLSFGIIIYYAIPISESLNLTFGVNEPITGEFSFFGEPHENLGIRARAYRNTSGAAVPALASALSEYTTEYPQ